MYVMHALRLLNNLTKKTILQNTLCFGKGKPSFFFQLHFLFMERFHFNVPSIFNKFYKTFPYIGNELAHFVGSEVIKHFVFWRKSLYFSFSFYKLERLIDTLSFRAIRILHLLADITRYYL